MRSLQVTARPRAVQVIAPVRYGVVMVVGHAFPTVNEEYKIAIPRCTARYRLGKFALYFADSFSNPLASQKVIEANVLDWALSI